jgi:hypothetical protein
MASYPKILNDRAQYSRISSKNVKSKNVWQAEL